LLAVQEEIARDVVGGLRVPLVGVSGPLVRHGTADVEAYNLFQQGKYYRGRLAPADLRRSIEFFTQAIERDSNFALAYAWRGSAHTLLAVFGAAPAREELPLARTDAEKALLLDSTRADVHWILGEIIGNQDRLRDPKGSLAAFEREILRALQLDPENARARFYHAMSLAGTGHADSAASEARRGLENDPLSSELQMVLGFAYRNMGKLDSAARYMREAVDYTPTFSLARQELAQLYLTLGKPDEAVAQFEQAALIGAARDSGQLAYGYAMTNRRRDAENILRSLLKSRETRYVPPMSIAAAYVGLHDNTEAFRWLDRAVIDNDPMFAQFIGEAPAFAPLRADPRYAALMRRVGSSR